MGKYMGKYMVNTWTTQIIGSEKPATCHKKCQTR